MTLHQTHPYGAQTKQAQNNKAKQPTSKTEPKRKEEGQKKKIHEEKDEIKKATENKPNTIAITNFTMKPKQKKKKWKKIEKTIVQ